MSLAYDEYLNEHIANVNKGLQWMQDNIAQNEEERAAISTAMEARHDDSKYNRDEYFAYDAYFYGGNRSNKVCQDFNRAWLLHQHRNPHHWQYWALINDDPESGVISPLPIPLNYIYEMIADWWSFSWRNNNLFEIFSWYNMHHNYQIMHTGTRVIVEDILKRMYAFLIAQATAERQDIDEISKQYMLYFMKMNEEPCDEFSEEEYFKHADDDEDKHYGVPEQKKFPMPDAKHVRSAIKFFNWVEPKYEEELAKAILARMKEYGLVLGEDISVGDENRFKKYIPKEAQDE